MNLRKLYRSCIFLLVSLLFFSCQNEVQKPDNLVLKIIETSDVHGAVFPYDFVNDRPAEGSLAQVTTYVREERSDTTQEVILLDNGDILQGQPTVYFSNFIEPDKPHILTRVMRYMGYDAGTVGNHDIEAGHPVYDRLNKNFSFPWLAANAVDIRTGKPYFRPYTVIERAGVKIAVLGLITPGIPKWLPPYIYENIRFEDMVETARKWVPLIREKEDPDVLIGLFHAGYDYTYGGESDSTGNNENASVLVIRNVPGFDLVLIGHDHKLIKDKVTDPENRHVLLLDPASSARFVSSATITMKRDLTTGHYLKKIEGNLIPMKEFAPDSAFMVTFSADEEKIRDYVSRPLGTFTTDVSATDALFGDASFTDLVHRVQLDISDADISFTAPLSLNAVIPAGTIYVRDMFKLYRFENLLYTMRLTGSEIRDYLEYSYSHWVNTMGNADDEMLLMDKKKNRLKYQYYNFDSAEGIDYTVDLTKPAGNRINISGLQNGTPFDENAWYKVAVNSYRGNGGGGHLTKGCGLSVDTLRTRILSGTDHDLRFYIMQWIEKQKTVDPRASGNWKFIPEAWAKAAEEREKDLFRK
ncbi:MAG: bifunctional metallophosphatase/5'-nucleotidase [Chlorobi bacterium]|nr:bifunctional metallophosphatase/5'-nucleotidase [Chlorobiota bacterium]